MNTVGLTPVVAVEKLKQHYRAATATAARVLETGGYTDYAAVTYPKLTVTVNAWQPIDRTEPFGYVEDAGVYSAVISKPELLETYLTEQLERLNKNYDCTIAVTDSQVRIPPEYIDGLAEKIGSGRRPQDIPQPTLDDVDDAIIDGDWDTFHEPEKRFVQASRQSRSLCRNGKPHCCMGRRTICLFADTLRQLSPRAFAKYGKLWSR